MLFLYRQQDLFRVLKAYTLYRPEEGYCQAQAPIAAVLLMHMPAEVVNMHDLCDNHQSCGRAMEMETIPWDGAVGKLGSGLDQACPTALSVLVPFS